MREAPAMKRKGMMATQETATRMTVATMPPTPAK
jgi:hypothetical protein